MVRVVINGEKREAETGSLRELLDRLGMPQRGVAVERNRRVVPHADLANTPLAEGDVLEIVSLVGGG